jgi:hypothetical protein
VEAIWLTVLFCIIALLVFFSLAASRKTGRYSGAASQADSDALLSQESLAWSFFLNNAVFAGLFLFLAFYVLRGVDSL